MMGMAARDERERSIDDRADHWGYLFLSFGLLVLVGYRAFTSDVASWDVLGLVIAGGLVATAYRARERGATRRYAALLVGALLVAAVVAGIAGVLLSD